MKDNELRFGTIRVNNFYVSLQPCVFDTRSEDAVDFFEVLVSKAINGDKPPCFSFHLVEDLGWFSWLAKFERPIRAEEVIEYNSFLQRKHMSAPTWKLSRFSVRELIELLQKVRKAK